MMRALLMATALALSWWRAFAAPLETYGQLPSIEEVAISPDGGMLAFVVTNGEQRRIVIRAVADHRLVATLNAGNQKVRNIIWGGSGHLLVTASTTGRIMDVISGRLETYMTTDYDIAAKTQRPLLNFPENDANLNLNTVNSLPTIRVVSDRATAFVQGTHFQDNRGQLALFRVDLGRNATSTESPGLPHTDDYAVGGRGVIAEAEYDAVSSLWALRLWNGHWQTVKQVVAPLDPPNLLGLGRTDGSVLVEFKEGDEAVLRELPAGTNTWSEPLPLANPDRLYRDVSSGTLIGESELVGEDQRTEFFDANDAQAWRAIIAAYPGQRVEIVNFTAARDKFVVRVDSPIDGPAYALVDLASKRASWLGSEYEGLKAADIAPVRPVSFKAADGMSLSGYLTLPKGKVEKVLPLVVLVHGGPAARDEPGFDWWSQALAARGYAVLRVNYRGSEGLGWAYQAAGFGQWGRKMQTDLADGVRNLAADGIVDSKRVCIVGASYGGYAALAGATMETGVYRCAVSVAGPTDLGRFVARQSALAGAQGRGLQRYWARYMGDLSRLDEISPAKHAQNAKSPILLIHGKDDTVVPYEQSQIMEGALRKAGVTVDLVTLQGEDHWLSRGETRLRMLTALTSFLEKNNPPG